MNRLRELREEKGLSLRELGLKVDMSASVLGNYERGDRQPKTETWEILAKFFEVPTSYIMGLTDNKIDSSNYLLDILNNLKSNDTYIESSHTSTFTINHNTSDYYTSNFLTVLHALDSTMDYLVQPNEEQAKLVTDTMIQAIILIGNIARISNEKNNISIDDLLSILSNINTTYKRSISTETLYSKDKSIQKHLKSLNEITNTLNTWYMTNLDKKKFNQKKAMVLNNSTKAPPQSLPRVATGGK